MFLDRTATIVNWGISVYHKGIFIVLVLPRAPATENRIYEVQQYAEPHTGTIVYEVLVLLARAV